MILPLDEGEALPELELTLSILYFGSIGLIEREGVPSRILFDFNSVFAGTGVDKLNPNKNKTLINLIMNDY